MTMFNMKHRQQYNKRLVSTSPARAFFLEDNYGPTNTACKGFLQRI